MNKSERTVLIRAYIDHFVGVVVTQDGYVRETRDNSDTEWAVDKLMDISRESPEELWEVLLEFLEHDPSMQAKAVMAAGPLEDCLAYRGEEVIARVEVLAAEKPKFNHLLGGVWRNRMSDAVWKRVLACRDEIEW